MFSVSINGKTAFANGDVSYAFSSAEIKETLCQASTFDFTISPTNPCYNECIAESEIIVYKDFVPYWKGFIASVKETFNKMRNVSCVGFMGYLARTITIQKEFSLTQTLPEYIYEIIWHHNSIINDTKKELVVGFAGDTASMTLSKGILDFNSSIDAIRNEQEASQKFVFCEYYNPTENQFKIAFYDWDNNILRNSQTIAFGENLLDFARLNTTEAISTGVVPLGKSLESHSSEAPNLTQYVDITSVNAGKNYLVNEAMASRFGRRFTVQHFDTIENPTNLKTAGQNWLNVNSLDYISLEVKAVDFGLLGITNATEMRLGGFTKVISEPFSIVADVPIVSKTVNLLKPEQSSIVLSKKIPLTYTEKIRRQMNEKRS